MSTIEVQSVSKKFGSFAALNGVSLGVAAGEVVVLVGPSGAGKSILIRTIAGLELPDEGKCLVEGLAPREHRTGAIGMVFQNLHLFPHLRVFENIALAPMKVAGKTRAQATEKAMSLLKMLRVEEQALKYPRQLSGGQQQRVAIARALAMEPRVMLFDEPTSALDPESVTDVLDAIKDLAIQGMTMIVVTHQMGFAQQVANRVAFIEKGAILEVSTPDEFFRSPKGDRVKSFLGTVLRY